MTLFMHCVQTTIPRSRPKPAGRRLPSKNQPACAKAQPKSHQPIVLTQQFSRFFSSTCGSAVAFCCEVACSDRTVHSLACFC